MYQVLYRKWRPQRFEDVYGQPQVTVTLQNELKNNRLNHAYLFTGSRGTGKTTCAKILAKAANCLNLQGGEPCCECEICKAIDKGSLTDVVEMDAASNRRIDDIRDVIDEAQFRPTKTKYRVYIIDEVHMLTTEAFNALLKTLEEPPEYVIFILATTDVHKLPATILSRCQRFDFNRIKPEEIIARLDYIADNEGTKLDEDAARLIAAVSDGGMRDALSLMDMCMGTSSHITTDVVRQAAGLARKDYIFDLASACINKNPSKALELIDRLHRESMDMARLCDEMLEHFRALMLIKTTRNPREHIIMSDDEFENAQTQSDYLTLGEIVYIMDILQASYARMGKGNSNRTEFEMAMVKLSAPELESTNEALTARVSALEKALKSGVVAVAQPTQVVSAKDEPEEESLVIPEEKPEEPKKVSPPPPPPVRKPEPEEKKQEAPKEEKSTPTKPNRPSLEDIYNNAQPFRQWSEVVESIRKYSKGIAAAFANTKAYVSGDYLLIDADSEIPFRLLKEGSQRHNVRKAIQETTGKVYKLGPYKKPDKPEEEKKDPLKELLENLKESGINVTEETEE